MPAQPTFVSIQYLRFIAATMVVFVHIAHSLTAHLGSDTAIRFAAGATGVDIFFVISGFIMYAITRTTDRAPGEFFLMRFMRVAPPYWIITTLLLLVVVLKPGLLFSSQFDPAHTVASYLFLPWQHPEGYIKPLLHVGWTLNLEFLFYALVSLTLAFRVTQTQRFWWTIGALVGLAVIGYAVQPQDPVSQVWTSSLLIEFALGMAIARLYFSGFSLPTAASIAAILVGFALLLAVQDIGGTLDPTRWIVAGLPAALIVWGALELEKRGWVTDLRGARYLGDISFALYLCHYFAVGAVRSLWPDSLIGGLANDLLFFGTSLIVAFVGTVLFYEGVEKPTIRVCQRAVKTWYRGRVPKKPALGSAAAQN